MLGSLQRTFLPIITAAALWGCYAVEARISNAELQAKRAEALARMRPSSRGPEQQNPNQLPLTSSAKSSSGVKNITFTDPRASAFYVDGTSIPDVDWDIGPSWSGMLPVSSDLNETRKLFFWFFPPGPEGSLDDLLFWTNGGPGCSSLEALLQENGPFSWSWGQARPTQNEFSWTNLSSLLYLEQPVGTGYSQGTPNITDENGIAEQITGFMQQFLDIFKELQGKKLYLSGESYAGMYVPYLANHLYENPTALNLTLTGFIVIDPVLGWYVIQQHMPMLNFVHKYEHVFAFNQSFRSYLESVSTECGYTDYLDKYLTYPPKGILPLPGNSTEFDPGCDTWNMVLDAVLLTNPAFNVYRVFDTYPILWDVLGFPGTFEQQQSPVYFDRADVKAAIHAPPEDTWTLCAHAPVFVDDTDLSLPPAFTVLPGIIQKSERAIVVHGLADFDLIAEGARVVLQNMTWNGQQGFQSAPVPDSFVVDGMGALGTVQEERGLTYYEVELSGHMVPQFSPNAAFQIMEYLMGFRAEH